METPDCQASPLESTKSWEANVTMMESRAVRVDEAIHSAEIEGLVVSSDTRADADSYVAGQIDSQELVARVRARYGLD